MADSQTTPTASGSDPIAPSVGGVAKGSDSDVQPQAWGRLEWMVSGSIGNSEVMTVGKCFIDAGQNNPPHQHPNCDEVLYVVRGTINHRIGDDYVQMTAGDIASIPAGSIHNATNIGTEQCELVIMYSSAYREVVGE